MIAVIFEVIPAPDARDSYISQAADLRPLLDRIDGFLGVERFQSLTDPGKLLSLSFFRDEDAVRAWRETAEHRLAQQTGRSGLFTAYRLCVAEVRRDYGLQDRGEAPG